jgi:trimethylamine---corrinoid protein Co-methyltransferase
MIALSTTDSRFERIHETSLMLLERCGLHLGAAASLLKRCRQLGLKTDSERVYFSAIEIEQALAQVPASFRLMARNSERTLDYRPGASFVGLGRSAAFVFDTNGRRRQATGHDFIEMMKLGQQLDEIKLVGNLVTPADIGPERVNDFMMAAQIRYSDKPYHLLHASDLPLLCDAFQIEPEALASSCEEGRVYAHTTVNTMSPMAISAEQSEHLMAMAENGIAINISPAPAMGSSSPCTIAGTLAVNNAEILAVLAITQLIRPGLPVLYGVFPSGTDMRSMAATFGSAEARLLEQEAVRMAHCYGLLTRGNVGLNEAFDCDFQAGAEAMFNFSEALRSNINYLPGCGLLASFAGASKAKLVMDAELAAMLQRYRRPWTAADEDLAVDLTCQVGPKGSFIMQPHTYSRCRSELYHPKVFCRSSYEKWREGDNLIARAERHAQRLIADFRNPPLPRSVEQRLIPLLV